MIDWTLGDGSDAALGALTATEYHRHGEPFHAARVRRPGPAGVSVAIFLGDYLFQMVGVPARAGFERQVSARLSQVARTRRDRGGERAVPARPAGGGLRFRL